MIMMKKFKVKTIDYEWFLCNVCYDRLMTLVRRDGRTSTKEADFRSKHIVCEPGLYDVVTGQ